MRRAVGTLFTTVFLLLGILGGAQASGQETADSKIPTLVSGAYHNCVVTDIKELDCWGSNVFGNKNQRFNTLQATPPPNLGPIKSVFAGAYSTCAVLETGEVLCWGLLSAGPVPEQLINPTSIVLGFQEACALLESQEILCWSVGLQNDVVLVDGQDWVEIVGPRFCARKESGLVYCASSDYVFTPSEYFREADSLISGTDQCVIFQGRIECTPPQSANDYRKIPIGLFNVRAASVGYGHMCAILETGSLQCWGRYQDEDNSFGGQTSVPKDLGAVTEVSLGGYHTCARRVSGAVWCWGSGKYLDLTVKQSTVPQHLRSFSFTKIPANPVLGTPVYKQVLAPFTGEWDAGTVLTYRWLVGGVEVSGANTSEFAPRLGDIGKKITFEVRAEKLDYQTVTISGESTVVERAKLTYAKPKISGAAKSGNTLLASAGNQASGTKITYSWMLNGKAIPKATARTLKILPTMKGKKVSVKATFTRAGYVTSSQTSLSVTVK